MSRVIIKNLPNAFTLNDLKEKVSSFCDFTDCKLIKSLKGNNIGFVGFKEDAYAKKFIKFFNNSYIKTNKINVEIAKSLVLANNKKKSNNLNKEKFSKEIVKDNLLDGNNLSLKEDNLLNNKSSNTIDTINNNSINNEVLHQVHVSNLPFTITEKELLQVFNDTNNINKIFIPRNKQRVGIGYAFVAFNNIEDRNKAISLLNKTTFQGRVIYLKESHGKPLPSNAISIKDITNDNIETISLVNVKNKLTNSNSFLFINQNTVTEAVAQKLNITKSELLNIESNKLAVEVSTMETMMISIAKEWLIEQGVEIRFLEDKNTVAVKSKRLIIIKNIPYSVNEETLKSEFEKFGDLIQFKLSPHNVIAIAEFSEEKPAFKCVKKMNMFMYKGIPLYVEYAPDNFIQCRKINNIAKSESSTEQKNVLDNNDNKNNENLLNKKRLINKSDNINSILNDPENSKNCTLLLKNIAFEATKEEIRDLVKQYGDLKSVRLPIRSDNRHKGYCFVDFMSNEQAKIAFSKLANTHFYGRKFIIDWANK